MKLYHLLMFNQKVKGTIIVQLTFVQLQLDLVLLGHRGILTKQ